MKTKTRKTRIWTDAQRAAAAERMKAAQAKRWARVETPTATAVVEPDTPINPPEVQAVIDTMSPDRKAKLAMIQARNLAGLAQTREGREALQRLEETHQPQTETVVSDLPEVHLQQPVTLGTPGAGAIVPPRPGSREIDIVVKNDGTMVSLYGPCICGAAKRQWHTICLKTEAERAGT